VIKLRREDSENKLIASAAKLTNHFQAAYFSGNKKS